MESRAPKGIRRWIGRTIGRKFTLLLGGFLAVQATMLVVGVTGVLHLGEEGGFINEAGRQRYRTLLVAVRGEEALAAGTSTAEVTRLLAEMDAYFVRFRNFLDADRRIEGLVFHGARHDALRAAVAQAEEVWRRELRPLVTVFEGAAPPAARNALARYQALAPEQVARLEAIVTTLEHDVRTNTLGLARFSALLLTVSFGLGALGFFMMRRAVTRPLRRLIDGARSIAAGAYDRHVPVSSHDEFGDLAETFNRMADAVSEKTARLTALNEIAVAIASAPDLQSTLNDIMRYGAGLTGSQAACLAFYDQETRRFRDWVTHGLSEHFVRNMSFRPGGAADEAFSAATTGAYVLSNDRPPTRHRLSKLARDEGIRSSICLPLTSHASRLGVIYFYRTDRDTFAPDEIELLRTFSNLVAGTIEEARLREELGTLARTDSLTGLLNRRVFDRRLEEEHRRAQRYGKPYALTLIDIDHFKRVNDSYGHPAGDEVLRAIGQLLARQFRDVDTVARFGGEEFAVIMPEISGAAATPVAERLRGTVAATPFRLPDGREIGVTVSIGVACFPDCADSMQAVVDRADQALYTAKEAGRNRVVLYRTMLKAQIERNPARIVSLLNENLENMHPVVAALDGKAAFLRDHGRCVQEIALRLGRALRLRKAELEMLGRAALLHDLGTATIPDAVLRKEALLTEEEWRRVRQHPVRAGKWLARVPALRRLVPVVRHHHERYDGEGYPDGLRGAAIPRLARVLAVADAWCAIRAERPQRRALSVDEARAVIAAGAGRQFDPAVVEVFLALPGLN